MVDKRTRARNAGKDFERYVAKDIGGVRNPITGRTRGEGVPDVQSDKSRLAVECKFRSQPFPKIYLDAIDEAKQTAAKAGNGYLGVVCWHVKNQRHNTDTVFMDWETFERLRNGSWT